MTADAVDQLMKDIKDRDADRRIQAEENLRAKAKSLTNGNSGCTKTLGEVLCGLAEMSCDQSAMLRQIIDVVPSFQTKAACKKISKGRGINWATAVAIITVLGFLLRVLF